MSKLTLKRVHEIIREEISNIEKINDTYNTDLKINPNSKIKKGKLKITKLIKYQEFIKENVK